MLNKAAATPKLKNILCFYRERGYGSLNLRTKNAPGKPGQFKFFSMLIDKIRV
jgi:hypothetical protein